MVDIIKKEKTFKLSKKGYVIIICSFFCILFLVRFCIYLFTDESNVKNIKIVNNYYLSDEYIKEIADIDYNDKYIFLFPSFKEMKFKNNPLFKNISIKRERNNTIIIDVSENSILGYCYDDNNVIGDYSDDYMQLVLSDGSKYDFDNKYIKGYGLLIKFKDISNDYLTLICEKLNNVNIDILLRISEIELTNFSFDENMVKLTMDDGYQMYSSISNLSYITNYLDIIISTKSTYKCIYIYNVDDTYYANVVDCKDFIK